jgi:hypothetical protein
MTITTSTASTPSTDAVRTPEITVTGAGGSRRWVAIGAAAAAAVVVGAGVVAAVERSAGPSTVESDLRTPLLVPTQQAHFPHGAPRPQNLQVDPSGRQPARIASPVGEAKLAHLPS